MYKLERIIKKYRQADLLGKACYIFLALLVFSTVLIFAYIFLAIATNNLLISFAISIISAAYASYLYMYAITRPIC